MTHPRKRVTPVTRDDASSASLTSRAREGHDLKRVIAKMTDDACDVFSLLHSYVGAQSTQPTNASYTSWAVRP